MELNKLNKLVAILEREKPKRYIDVYDTLTEVKLARKLTHSTDLNIKDYLLNLNSDSIYVRVFAPNGNTFIEKGIGQNIDLNQVKKEIANQTQKTNEMNTKGMNAPELMANTIVLKKLEKEYADLKLVNQEIVRKNKKLKKKIESLKEENLYLNVSKNSKPFLSSEVADKLIGVVSGLTAKQPAQGLNAPETSNLTSTKLEFINYVKMLSDENIDEMYNVYMKHLKVKNQNIQKNQENAE